VVIHSRDNKAVAITHEISSPKKLASNFPDDDDVTGKSPSLAIKLKCFG